MAELTDLKPGPIALMAMAKLIVQKMVTDIDFRVALYAVVEAPEQLETQKSFRDLFRKYGIWAGEDGADFNIHGTNAVLYLMFELLRRSVGALNLGEENDTPIRVEFPEMPAKLPDPPGPHITKAHMVMIQNGKAYEQFLGLPDEDPYADLNPRPQAKTQ